MSILYIGQAPPFIDGIEAVIMSPQLLEFRSTPLFYAPSVKVGKADYDVLCEQSSKEQLQTLDKWGARHRNYPLVPTFRLE